MDWSPWQDTITAIGTLTAVVVSVVFAIASERRAKRANDELARSRELESARRVSAWVEEDFEPFRDGHAYRRNATVHVANESDEPVFDAHVVIGIGFETRSVGPLSVPPIATLPPRYSRVWDITVPLEAHNDSENPRAEITFSDANQRRWCRGLSGGLREVTSRKPGLSEAEFDEGKAIAQLGDLESAGNPIAVGIRFLHALTDEGGIDTDLRDSTLAPEAAEAWDAISDEAWDEIRTALAAYTFTSFAEYPAPHISYVRLVPAQHGGQMAKDSTVVSGVQYLTMTFVRDRGWRVFAYGERLEPHHIWFPDGTLDEP